MIPVAHAALSRDSEPFARLKSPIIFIPVSFTPFASIWRYCMAVLAQFKDNGNDATLITPLQRR